jgi:hypothetical protein
MKKGTLGPYTARCRGAIYTNRWGKPSRGARLGKGWALHRPPSACAVPLWPPPLCTGRGRWHNQIPSVFLFHQSFVAPNPPQLTASGLLTLLSLSSIGHGSKEPRSSTADRAALHTSNPSPRCPTSDMPCITTSLRVQKQFFKVLSRMRH